jgi:hypothetical protein
LLLLLPVQLLPQILLPPPAFVPFTELVERPLPPAIPIHAAAARVRSRGWGKMREWSREASLLKITRGGWKP